MPCYHPLSAWRLPGGGPLFFGSKEPDYLAQRIKIPCGQCVGCRLERSRQWAMRCIHEASLHEDNCFITLTYSDDRLPEGGTLVKKHFQDFMKRFRFRVDPVKLRFFHCGEYGEKYRRPHYHALIFGYDFPDKVFKRKTGQGHRVYTSELLSNDWSHGLCEIGAVTFESAAYCARYIMGKVTGDLAQSYYEVVDGDGVVTDLLPEYVTMSRRPGIGRGWFDKFPTDVFPKDYIIVNGVKCRPPRFYDTVLKAVNEFQFLELKERRELRSLRHSENNSPDRLKVREEIALRKLKRLTRDVG